MTVPWVYVDDVDAPTLATADRHHLERVLRVRVGDAVVVSDGAGRWREGVLALAGAVEPRGEIVEVPRFVPPITIAFALTKGERPELVVQKLTELGCDRIVPFHAARSVARWDDRRAESHVERLRRVAREAGMQCRRAWLPEVGPLGSFEALVAQPGAALADAGGAPPTLATSTILVGPEGGWTAEERGAAPATVGLGPHVLRAETAAIAAATVLGALRARLVDPAP